MIMFEALKRLNLFDKTENVIKFGKGFYNRSYIVEATDGRYLLEVVDVNAVGRPDKAVANYRMLEKHLQKHGDAVALMVEKLTDDEKNDVVAIEGTYWRGFRMPESAGLFSRVINGQMVYEIGRAIGRFHRSLIDFPLKDLQSPNPEYYNVERELDLLQKIVYKITDANFILYNDAKFALDRKEDLRQLTHLVEIGEFPLRVVHNNLRLNNFLFDINTYQVIAVNCYDTAIPGTLLSDLGDALRLFSATTREDESNLSLVRINITFFKDFLRGYFAEVRGFITQKEVDYIVDAMRLQALASGLRYLNDYFNESKTYRISYKEQNIDRTRNQFRLVEDIEIHYEGMRNTVSFIYNQAVNE
jgi:Ser/Thr protein kinase RdoA (MazF antagonist)